MVLKKSLLLALVLPLSSAYAMCPSATTAIALVEAGPAIHVTGRDQNCNALPPANLSIVNGFQPACPTNAVGMAGSSPTKVTVTPDSTGLNFQAVSGATGMAACNTNIVYTDGTLTLTSVLSVSLSSGVTSTSLTSP